MTRPPSFEQEVAIARPPGAPGATARYGYLALPTGDRDAVFAAVTGVASRYDALRGRWHRSGEQSFDAVAPVLDVEVAARAGRYEIVAAISDRLRTHEGVAMVAAIATARDLSYVGVAMHRTFVDGTSFDLVMDELRRVLVGGQGIVAPVVSYESYVERQSTVPKARIAQNTAWWQERTAGQHGRGLDILRLPDRSSGVRIRELRRVSTAAVQQAARANELTTRLLLLDVVVDVLRDVAPSGTVPVLVAATPGRVGRFAPAIGNFTMLLPLVLRGDATGDAQSTRRAVMAGLHHWQFSFAAWEATRLRHSADGRAACACFLHYRRDRGATNGSRLHDPEYWAVHEDHVEFVFAEDDEWVSPGMRWMDGGFDTGAMERIAEALAARLDARISDGRR